MASENKADPQWVRETLVEDLADLQRAEGKIPETRKLEQIIDEDIRYTEALDREAKFRPGKSLTKVQAEAEADKGESVEKAEHAKGRWATPEESRAADKEATKRVYRSDFKEGTDPIPTPCKCGKCRVCCMRLRLSFLSMPDDTGEPIYPKYFRRINDELWSWKLGTGPYFRQPVSTGRRVLQRRLEQICDESNGIPGLGYWWVK